MDGFLFKLVTPLLAAGSMAETIDKLARTPLSKIVIISAVLTILRMALFKYLRDTPKHQRYGTFNVAKWLDSFADAIVYAAVVVFMLVRPFVLQTFYIPSGSMIDTLHVGDFVVLNKNIYRHSDPKDGEVVVFKPPATALFPGQEAETDFIKRLIGTPGDVVEWKGAKLYRNGKPVDEPYADYTTPNNTENPPLSPEDNWPKYRSEQASYKLVQDGGQYISVLYNDTSVNGFPYDTEHQTYGQGTVKPVDADQAKRWRDAPPAAVPAGYYFFMGDNRNGSLDGRYWGLVPRDSVIGRGEFIWLPLARMRKIN